MAFSRPWATVNGLTFSRPSRTSSVSVTALACTGLDDGRMGRCLTQPLDPAKLGQISRSEFCAWSWNWISLAGDRPAGGLISVCGEFKQGQQWWLLATDGLYRSTDAGATLKKVLDQTGTLIK